MVHQSTTLSTDFSIGIPDDWVFHATTSGYMDRNRWFKAIKQFCKLFGAHSSNNQVLFFDEYNSHWDADALDIMSSNYTQRFFKSGDSINGQSNDNGFNIKEKSIYCDERHT